MSKENLNLYFLLPVGICTVISLIVLAFAAVVSFAFWDMQPLATLFVWPMFRGATIVGLIIWVAFMFNTEWDCRSESVWEGD